MPRRIYSRLGQQLESVCSCFALGRRCVHLIEASRAGSGSTASAVLTASRIRSSAALKVGVARGRTRCNSTTSAPARQPPMAGESPDPTRRAWPQRVGAPGPAAPGLARPAMAIEPGPLAAPSCAGRQGSVQRSLSPRTGVVAPGPLALPSCAGRQGPAPRSRPPRAGPPGVARRAPSACGTCTGPAAAPSSQRERGRGTAQARFRGRADPLGPGSSGSARVGNHAWADLTPVCATPTPRRAGATLVSQVGNGGRSGPGQLCARGHGELGWLRRDSAGRYPGFRA